MESRKEKLIDQSGSQRRGSTAESIRLSDAAPAVDGKAHRTAGV